MKVALVADAPSIHTQRMFHWLVEHGVDVFLCDEDNVEYMKFRIQQFKPDIVHGLFLATAGIKVQQLGMHPYVVTALGSDLLQPSRYENVQSQINLCLQEADAFIALCPDLHYKGLACGASDSKSFVIPFGVNTHEFCPALYSPFTKPFRDNGCTRVILDIRFMGQLYNHDSLLRAFKTVLGIYPDTKLVIQPPGWEPGYQEYVAGIVEELKMADNILTNEGELPSCRLPQVYNAVDVVVSIPTTDGQSVSNLEAMACHVPVIATDNLTNRSILPLDWLVDPQNPKDISRALLKILQGKYNRARLRQHRHLVQEHFEQDVVMNKLLDVYRGLL